MGRIILILFGLLAAGYLAVLGVLEHGENEPVFDSSLENPFVTEMPKGFLWGAATSAHQIEGGNVHNDWARFEANEGNIRDGMLSGAAADHWNRVAEDLNLLRVIGANAYRFSIEWSRVEPVDGQWDEIAWAHYGDEIAQLRDADIEPMVTLLHFTIPDWLAARGGDLPRGITEIDPAGLEAVQAAHLRDREWRVRRKRAASPRLPARPRSRGGSSGE